MTERRVETLYHFTCEHGHAALGTHGVLKPASMLVNKTRRVMLPWWSSYVWLTDMPTPDRAGLGLTSHLIGCDRMVHRYRVLDPMVAEWWPTFARTQRHRGLLEEVPGSRPVHWWVAQVPVPVVLDER